MFTTTFTPRVICHILDVMCNMSRLTTCDSFFWVLFTFFYRTIRTCPEIQCLPYANATLWFNNIFFLNHICIDRFSCLKVVCPMQWTALLELLFLLVVYLTSIYQCCFEFTSAFYGLVYLMKLPFTDWNSMILILSTYSPCQNFLSYSISW